MTSLSNVNLRMDGSWNDRKVVLPSGSIMDLDRAARNAAGAAAGGSIVGFFAGLVERVRQSLRSRRTLAELEALDDRTLADLGITRSDIPAIAAGVFARDARNDGDRFAVANTNRRNIAA